MSDIENIKGRMRAAFATTPLTDDKWQAVLDVLHAHGYRRCAEGQGVTQWCDRANKAEAVIARLTGDLAGANRECEVRNQRELGYMARAQSAEAEVERLRAENETLRLLVDTVMAIPKMTDAQLAELYANCHAAVDAARKEST